MTQHYDLIVAGGGPAGLEAAKTAAQFGLKVALVERKTDPAKIMRSCAQMFLMNMDSFYNERMYFSKEQKRWVFPANGFSVNYDGPYREFYACHFVAPDTKSRIEIGDYERNAAGAGTPAVVFDKGALLGGLCAEGKQAGVDFYLGRNVVFASCTKGAVEVKTAEGDRLTGAFCIAADGINSRLAQVSGLNRDRTFLYTRISLSHYVTGVSFDRSEAILLGMSWDRQELGPVPFCILPSVYRDDEYWLFIGNDRNFQYLTTASPFKSWFPQLAVTHTRVNVVNNWSPATEPFKDNILFAGDSCWFAEAENTGALLSGHRAACAVCEALQQGRPDKSGVSGYIDWWKKNWTGAHDYREFLCYPIFNRLFTEEEHNYLHGLVREKLPWTLDPFKLYSRLMQGLGPHRETIKAERPQLAEKIRMFRPELALEFIKPAARAGFPNR